MAKFVKSAAEHESLHRQLDELVRSEFACVKQVPNLINWNKQAHQYSVFTMISCSWLLSGRQGVEDSVKECWTAQMHATKLPFAYFYLEESVPHRRHELPSTQSFVMRVLEAGLADFGLVDRRKSFVGRIWSIYMSSKISQQKALLSQSMDVPAPDWKSRSIAADLIERLEEGLEDSKLMQTVGSDRCAKRTLLAACDTRLLARWGEDRFSSYISPLGISLKEWLSIA